MMGAPFASAAPIPSSFLPARAGEFIRSFFNLTRVDVGFDRAQLTTFGFVLPGGGASGHIEDAGLEHVAKACGVRVTRPGRALLSIPSP